MPPADLSPLNDREYRKLLLTLTLNSQQLDLLVAITDDRNLQDQLITAYEAYLKAQGIAPLRARLDPKRPSLRATLEVLVAQTPALQNREPAVVTVLNAGELLGVRLSDEKSEQEKFFFSLQWTREALRNFAFPIVLWLPDAVATRMAQQAPDFWSWRGGVFEFVAEARMPERGEMVLMPSREMTEEREQSPVATDDLQQQITQLEQTSPESPLLITLYNNLGEAYASQYDYKQALELYEKALTLAKAKSDPAGEARSLRNLGDALRECGRPFQAVDYYQQALGKYRELGDRQGEEEALNRLGLACQALGQYPQAIEYHQQTLAIARGIGDRQGEAASLGNLGNAYRLLGQYPQAIEYYQQQLAIAREIGDRQGKANSLGGLGIAYYSLGQYPQAIEYLQQTLAIAREISDRQCEANSLGGLGIAYYFLGQYPQAVEYHQQTLAIAREIGDRLGEANSLGNLGCAYDSLGQYQQAIDYHQQQLAIAREISDRHGEANSLFNLGSTLDRVDKKWDARQSYEAAKALYQDMGSQQDVADCDKAIYDLG
ncbi:tetratricopeptide repeat protein [Nodosilinea sp. LEGE 07298]|uniref:tetratricopeptide repeat protein n=1 Tax=Nodosilinea sp. LEGE 07298 TaxID=2777970 RepID=UPI001D156395|nr:tetratricopeptide repeat protein [Nodosilinea sp. LEGE 07298]